MNSKRLEWGTIIVAVISGVIFFSIGFFLFVWGMWTYINGYGTKPAGLEYLMIIFGVSFIVIGIYIVLKELRLAEKLKVKRS